MKPPEPEAVESIDDLRQRCERGEDEFIILLAGGLAYSKKYITYEGDGEWYIFNAIDGTEQSLATEDLWSLTHIGEALDNHALLSTNPRRP